ncbi:MAG TPA: carbohydrate kinase [Candidatus Sulfotelmatobacter sp.]|nr:carbohydrate kinase [Candidatus Sulfotelmatobacter sp.]
MSNTKNTIVGLGELLWDMFPAGKQLGGAPANFAYITSLLGDNGIPASRLGEDSLGLEAIHRLGELGLSTEFIQRDSDHPTGTVKVEVDDAGQAQFKIAKSVAWDFFDWTLQWQQLAQRADAVCFGTLAQRSEQSCTTVRSFLLGTRARALRVCDINLRQTFFTAQVVAESMKLATIVKLNHEELPRVMRLVELEHRGEEDSARRLLASYDLKLVCITRGTNGSLLVSADECSEHPGFSVKVADTVGAGDAFTAALVHGYLRGISLDAINETANRVGAWVASQPGGTPAPKGGDLNQSLAEIG